MVASPTPVTGTISPPATVVSVAAAPVPVPEQVSAHQQLLSALRPLQQFVDGTHRLSIQLRPAELGAVSVEFAMNSGELSVQLVAERASTAHVLRASIDELRSELERDGFRAGSFDVAQHYGGQQHRRREAFSEVDRLATLGSLGNQGSLDTASDGEPRRKLVGASAVERNGTDGRIDVRI
jgi:hypothetical protein